MVNPVYAKGRWYKIFLESTGSVTSITTIDGPIEEATRITDGYLKLPTGLRVVEFHMDIDGDSIGVNTTIPNELMKFTDGSIAIKLPESSAITEATIYVFGYFS